MRLRSTAGPALGAVWLGAFSSLLASSAIDVPLEGLASRATLVVEGRVAGIDNGVDPSRGTVATYVSVAVERVVRGPAGLDRVVLRQPGGRLDDKVLVVDAAPRFDHGEPVYLFLEPARDGTLRTVGAHYGKFSLVRESARGPVTAERELDGAATASRRRAHVRRQSVRVAELDALTLGTAGPPETRPWRARPPGWDALLRSPRVVSGDTGETALALDPVGAAGTTAPRFAPDSMAEPSRWEEPDIDMPVRVRVRTDGNPLGDAAAARLAVGRALDAWSMSPQARVVLVADSATPAPTSASPTAAFTGVNTVFFGDPWDDIADPVDCTGVLAIGGYWRGTTPGRTVNGVTFYPVLEMYTIVNDGFECFLGDPDDLAEVLAHEIGHGLGFGHSSAPDALMRAVPYGGRGPRLGDDDLDAAHCHYPHAFDLVSPAGGERWGAGSMRAIRWDASEEFGGDAGTVALELSTDGGQSWQVVSDEEPNDGYFRWRVPDDVAGPVSIRVARRAVGQWLPAHYPEVCSQAMTSLPVEVAATSSPVAATGAPLEPRPRRGAPGS